MRRYIHSKVGNAALAEDLTGEVFLKARCWLRRDRSVKSVQGWLYATAPVAIACHRRSHVASGGGWCSRSTSRAGSRRGGRSFRASGLCARAACPPAAVPQGPQRRREQPGAGPQQELCLGRAVSRPATSSQVGSGGKDYDGGTRGRFLCRRNATLPRAGGRGCAHPQPQLHRHRAALTGAASRGGEYQDGACGHGGSCQISAHPGITKEQFPT